MTGFIRVLNEEIKPGLTFLYINSGVYVQHTKNKSIEIKVSQKWFEIYFFI